MLASLSLGHSARFRHVEHHCADPGIRTASQTDQSLVGTAAVSTGRVNIGRADKHKVERAERVEGRLRAHNWCRWLSQTRSSFGRANGVSRGSLAPSIFSHRQSLSCLCRDLVASRGRWPACSHALPAGPCGERCPLGQCQSFSTSWSGMWMASGPARSHSAPLPTHEKTPMLVASSQPLPPPTRMRGDTHGRRAMGGGRRLASPPRGRHTFENRGLGLRGRCQGVDVGKPRDETRSLGRPDLAAISVDVEYRRNAVEREPDEWEIFLSE